MMVNFMLLKLTIFVIDIVIMIRTKIIMIIVIIIINIITVVINYMPDTVDVGKLIVLELFKYSAKLNI